MWNEEVLAFGKIMLDYQRRWVMFCWREGFCPKSNQKKARTNPKPRDKQEDDVKQWCG